MTNNEAIEILEKSDAEIIIDDNEGTAIIAGQLTIEELYAVLQLLEYNA